MLLVFCAGGWNPGVPVRTPGVHECPQSNWPTNVFLSESVESVIKQTNTRCCSTLIVFCNAKMNFPNYGHESISVFKMTPRSKMLFVHCAFNSDIILHFNFSEELGGKSFCIFWIDLYWNATYTRTHTHEWLCRLLLQPRGPRGPPAPAPPALPTRLPGSFSHCWEEQDAATAAGSKLSTSTSLKKKLTLTLTLADASTSSDAHRFRPGRGSFPGISWQEDMSKADSMLISNWVYFFVQHRWFSVAFIALRLVQLFSF